MIIWIASYPKSGNTWVRSFLNSLLYSIDGKANLKNLIKINQYPLRSHFKNIVKDIDNILEISKKWTTSQDIINFDKKIKFLKTHHSLCNINSNNFTNLQNTLGVIYVVRDPRNVVTSILNHYSKKNYHEAREFIFEENKYMGRDLNKNKFNDNQMLTIISSWKTNYNSWKSFPKNYFLIKYENLIENPEKEFFKLSKYLSKILNVKLDEEKIKIAIKSNSFENLKKLEDNYGFKEAVEDEKERKKIKFFNLGPKNKWQDLLDFKTKNLIEEKFKIEMKELGYL